MATAGAREAAMMRRWARQWLRSCREMPARALAVLGREASAPEKRVHDFRRLMKAWRALLRLAPAGLVVEARAIRSDVARLRRTFGAVRDATMVAATLKRLRPELVLADEGRAEADKLLLEHGVAVRAELERLSMAMAGWSVAGETGDFLVLAFRHSYRRARREARRNPRRMNLKRLHCWRSAVIDLGYQLAFFQPAGPARLRRQTKEAERLRGHLGQIVDLDIARAYLAAGPSDGGGVQACGEIKREIEREVARRRRKAARLAGRLFDRRARVAGARLRAAMEDHPPRRVRLS
jgi:CHAD domain-containing protein